MIKSIFRSKLVIILILCLQTQLMKSQISDKPFPTDAWEVYGWTQFTSIDKNTAPLAKGGPIIMRWTNIEPQNNKHSMYLLKNKLHPKAGF